MTAWISNDILTTADALRVPGAYGTRRPRIAREPLARTDVAGFVGFERRVRRASANLAPDRQAGPGHDFRVAVSACRVPVGDGEVRVAGDTQFELSADLASVPMGIGEAVRFALIVVDAAWVEDAADLLPPPPQPPALTLDQQKAEDRKRIRRRRNVVVLSGAPAPAGQERAPDAAAEATGVSDVAATAWDETPDLAKAHKYARLADVQVRRVSVWGFRVVVIPAQRLIRCDDWRDFVQRSGPLDDDDDDGTILAHSVRGFFANGGARCYVTSVDRPEPEDEPALARSLDQMLGEPGDSEEAATGVGRLLLVPEVAVLDLPDLYARRTSPPEMIQLPPALEDGCFRQCEPSTPVAAAAVSAARQGEPLYDFETVTTTQTDLLQRCIGARWRVFLLFCPPLVRDPATGRFGPPGLIAADEWRAKFHGAIGRIGDPEGVSVAGLYYPWLIVQESTGAAERELPPTGFVAGVIASRNLRRGPAVSPANERIATAVAATVPVDDESLADLYDPFPDGNGNTPPAVNVLRAPPGGGVEVWGARTLSSDPWLRFVSVRRGLSAIERQCHAALQRAAFEPNTPALWMQVTQIVLNVLMTLFRTGALRGATPAEAFYVRCDASINPPESVAEGRLFVEVGVAIAAPAEFVIFRLGRDEGVVEVLE